MPAQTFTIAGLHCGSCTDSVGARLRAHEAVRSAEVTLDPPQVVLEATRALSAEEVNAWLAPLERYRVSAAAPAAAEPSPVSWRPLILLLVWLLSVTAATQAAAGHFDFTHAMHTFMGGFFVAFSFFKFLDLRGFASAYRGYDLVAKAWPPYGMIYPFIEFGLGLAYLAHWQPLLVNAVTAVVMSVSLAGVLRAVLSKQKIRCACLGTGFNLPMSTVTIIEDALMLAMAAVMLV